MTIEVITKDCTALTDAEMSDMADLSAAGADWGVGVLSKQAEAWVLVSQAFEKGQLRGFVLSTLERIGGTPALLLGVGCVGRTKTRATTLRGLMHDQFHKARMAFPDEDVVVATRMLDIGPLDAFKDLESIRPWPDERPNGEERAWGRRLAKRFDASDFDDRTMVARTTAELLVFDHESLNGTTWTPRLSPGSTLHDLFSECDRSTGRHLIAFGWAMAEFLDQFQKPAG